MDQGVQANEITQPWLPKLFLSAGTGIIYDGGRKEKPVVAAGWFFWGDAD